MEAHRGPAGVADSTSSSFRSRRKVSVCVCGGGGDDKTTSNPWTWKINPVTYWRPGEKGILVCGCWEGKWAISKFKICTSSIYQITPVDIYFLGIPVQKHRDMQDKDCRFLNNYKTRRATTKQERPKPTKCIQTGWWIKTWCIHSKEQCVCTKKTGRSAAHRLTKMAWMSSPLKNTAYI